MIRQHWPTLGLLTGMTASEGMAGILAPPYLHSLGFELWIIGIVIGLYGWTMLLSRLPVGLLYRPRLARGLLALALLGMAASSMLYPVVDQVLPLCAVRLLHGLSYGAGSTVILALYMDRLAGRRERAMTWYMLAITGGFLIGNFLGGVLVDWLGFRAGFTLAGAVAVGSAILLLWERPISGDGVPEPSREVERRASPGQRTGAGWLEGALNRPELASVGLVSFAIAFFLALGATYFPLYGIAVGLTLTEVGLVRSMQSLMMMLFTPAARWPMRWWGHRRASYLALACQSSVLMATPALTLFGPLVALFGLNGALRGIMSTANAVSLAESTESNGLGRGVTASIYNAGRDLGNLSSPMLGGFVASLLGLSTMFVVVPPLTVFGVLGAIGVLEYSARRGRRQPAEAV